MSHHIPTVRTVRELRAALEFERHAGRSIGLVPTMGALHEGHSSLIKRAREQCDVVVVSVFVNPSQFDRLADLERYPRQEATDAELAAKAGADLVFAPAVEEVYPQGFATQVQVVGIADRLEGAARGPEHFRGVSTVVTKLLCMALPDVAYFGQKDAQQLLVIRRLVADLNLPVRLEVCPTVREADGLALSSRNAQLSAKERGQALGLYAGLSAAAELVGAGERSGETLLSAAHAAMHDFEIEPEYLALVDPDSFEPVARLEQPALLAVAAHVGSVRLIDNVILDPSNFAAPSPSKTGDVTSQEGGAVGQRPAGRNGDSRQRRVSTGFGRAPRSSQTRKVPACSA
jgi:pantoate--beta-alanine ligase